MQIQFFCCSAPLPYEYRYTTRGTVGPQGGDIVIASPSISFRAWTRDRSCAVLSRYSEQRQLYQNRFLAMLLPSSAR